jgi:hypothetical protein
MTVLSNFRSSSGSRSIPPETGVLSISSANSILDRFFLLGVGIPLSIGLIFRDSFLVLVKEKPNSGSESTSNTRAIISNKAKTLSYGTDVNIN